MDLAPIAPLALTSGSATDATPSPGSSTVATTSTTTATAPSNQPPAGCAAPTVTAPFSDLSRRALTGVIAVPILIALVAWSATGFWVVMVVAAAFGALELTHLLASTRSEVERSVPAAHGLRGVGAAVAAGAILTLGAGVGAPALGAALVVCALLAIPRSSLRAPALAVLLVAPLCWMLWWVRADAGPWWIALAFATTWMGDMGAYFVGKRWGRRKLAPRVSPNKTIEGALGGVLVSAALGALLGPLALDIDWPVAAAMAAMINVVGQGGDLLESKLKRARNVKDSGRSIPGYGGMLDKVDSLLVSTPVLAAAVLWLS